MRNMIVLFTLLSFLGCVKKENALNEIIIKNKTDGNFIVKEQNATYDSIIHENTVYGRSTNYVNIGTCIYDKKQYVIGADRICPRCGERHWNKN